MTNVLEIYNSLKGQYNNEKEHPEKFIQTLMFANKENIDFLSSKNIKLKPSQWIVLSMDPNVLQKHILRAEELGFIDAYMQNPAFIKSDVDAIIKRISELEHLGIPYKNEKGKYQSYLFSTRGYNYIVGQNKEKKNIISPELVNYANRIIETFALNEAKEEILSKIPEVSKENLGIKDALIEIFKSHCDNLDFLSSTIDEILVNSEEQKMGRVA